MTNNDIKTLFNKFGAPLERDDVWSVQSATVIKHKALERLAAAAGIVWHAPQVLRSEREEAVILVTGELDKRTEWSIGEALINVNYRVSGKQAAYPFAMAEKRAKDRVILKLCGLHGLYSEDEADDFKQPSAPIARKPGGEAVTPVMSPPALAIANEEPPEGVPVDLWETAVNRARGGVDAYRNFWKNDTTADERALLLPYHESLKALATSKQKEAA
jgi:hypothetical protein